MAPINYTQNYNISNFSPQRNLLGIGNLNEADFADIACAAIATGLFSGNIFPIYPVYCVRLYTIITAGVSGGVGILSGLIISCKLAKYLPSCVCKTISSID